MRIANLSVIVIALTTLAVLPSKAVERETGTASMKAMMVREYGPPEVLKLEDVPRPVPKENEILIHGGSGGVGTMAIQIAKARGARVIATASTANQDLLKELGADVAVDYTSQKFEDVARDVDVVLDSVGKDTLTRSYGIVKKGGFIATLVARLNQSELDKHGIRGASISVKPDANA